MIRAAIAGGTGYTGGELFRILLGHPEVQIVAATTTSSDGVAVSSVHRDLIGETDLCFGTELNNPDVIFLCLGHGISRQFLDTHDISPECRIQPYWAKIVMQLRDDGVPNPTISLLDSDGALKENVLQVLDIIAKYDVILATGHISHDEAFALIPEAARRGVKKIIVTHVTFPTTRYSVDEQRKLIGYGAYMEHCYTTYATGKSDFAMELEQIKAIGSEHVVLSTDLGQKKGLYPDVGLQKYCEDLFDNGIPESDIRKMVSDNPRWLLGK